MRRRATIAAITVATLVAVGVLAALAIQSSYDSNLAVERSKLAATAAVTAELIAQQMRDVGDVEQATLQRAAFITAIGSGDPARIDIAPLQAMLTEVQALRPEFQFAAISDAQGTTRVTSPPDPAVIGKNFAFRDWYQGVLRTGGTYVSSAYVSAVKGAPLVVAVATPIRVATPSAAGVASGPVIGVLFIGYKIGSVQAFVDRLASLQQINLRLTDQAGVIVARQGGISGELIKASGAPEVAAALAGKAITMTSSNTIAAGVPVSGLGWTISATTSLSGTVAATERNTTTLIAAGLLIALGAAGAALVVLAGRLERATSRHAASAAELRTVLNALTDAVQFFGADGSLVSRNPAAERVYQLGNDDRTTAAFDPRWELLREDGSILPMDDGPLAVAMRTHEDSEGVVVGVRSRANHLVIWQSISTVLIRGPASEVSGYVSCARNITERMRTDRELGVLSRASQQLSASLVPRQVVGALTTAAAELCSAPGEAQRRAQLFLIDGPTMTMTGEHDPASPVKLDGVGLPVVDHPYIQRVIATREAAVAELDYEDFGPAVAAVMRRSEIKNCAWVPLVRDDRVFAILAVAGRQHALIGAQQLQRLKTLATIGELALTNAEAHEKVAELARTDPLTGVGNRRALDDRLGHLPRTRFALVAIDVDDLKKVNDTHGHDAGDEMLASLAVTLGAELRPSDMLARTGGDEFVALLVDCDAQGACELGKRLQRATALVRFGWGTPSISVGCAAGAAGDPPQAVAKAADLALYAAKQQAKTGALAQSSASRP